MSEEMQNTMVGTGPCYAPRQCCFCGAVHRAGSPMGYGGEIQCDVCDKGGNGEPDEPGIFYKRVGII
jgi:hypothetical protein